MRCVEDVTLEYEPTEVAPLLCDISEWPSETDGDITLVLLINSEEISLVE